MGEKTMVEKVEATICESSEDFSDRTRVLPEGAFPPKSPKVEKKKEKPLFFAWLVSLGGPEKGKDHRVLKEKTTIGKSEDSDLTIRSDFASRNHAILSYENRKYVLSDLESTNHTYVDEKKVSRRILKDSDIIKFGDSLYKFKCL
jgi:hypothetical protein